MRADRLRRGQAGGWAIARDLRALGHDVPSSREVVEMIRAREPDALRLVNEGARLLGTAIADAVNVLNPSTVVLGGDIANAHDQLLAHVREVVYTRSLPLATRRLEIVSLDRELEQRLESGASLVAWA